MFVVDEAAATASRTALQQGGELSAVIELRRHFPLITDNAEARRCVRTIAGWKPLPPIKPKWPRSFPLARQPGAADSVMVTMPAITPRSMT